MIPGKNPIFLSKDHGQILPQNSGLGIKTKVGSLRSYAETQSYKYCYLNEKNGVGISGASGALGTITEETDNQIDDEVEVDVELEDLSVAVTADECGIQSDDLVVSMEAEETSSVGAVTQFVEDNIDLNIVSIFFFYFIK